MYEVAILPSRPAEDSPFARMLAEGDLYEGPPMEWHEDELKPVVLVNVFGQWVAIDPDEAAKHVADIPNIIFTASDFQLGCRPLDHHLVRQAIIAARGLD